MVDALTRTSWLALVLRLLPARLHAALDAWSYGVARKRAARRRSAARRP